MVRQVISSESRVVPTVSQPLSGWMHTTAQVLAGTAIVSSAFHFWPFENNKAWQMLSPPKLAGFVWIVLLAGHASTKGNRRTVTSLLPHLSVFAYLMVNVLSVAFARDLGRAGAFTVKLMLMLVGGYVLFSSAISGTRSLRTMYGLTVVAVMISVSYCLATRFGFDSDRFGFYDSAYKYGTYVGTLAPLSGAYLFTSSRWWRRLLGAILVIGALISSGSLGAVAAILAGMVASAILIPRWSVRLCIMGCLVLVTAILILLHSYQAVECLQSDIRLAEKDGINLKQRYIEWQAEVNLLEERSITGTAAGCINEHRSDFYYRLPKLNTLRPFDQNGWLAAGAETGILGLVCLCWIVVHYFKLAYSQVTTAGEIPTVSAHRFAIANFAGLAAACTANLFSSVHYNGVLIVLVLVLALIFRTNQLFGESQSDGNRESL